MSQDPCLLPPTPVFSRGPNSHEVPMSMHVRHRENVVAAMSRHCRLKDTALILAGGDEKSVYDTDTNWDFKQESQFQYLFGVKEPGCMGVITLSGKSILFVPRFPVEYQCVLGSNKALEWFAGTYLVDEARYVDEVAAVLREHGMKHLLNVAGNANRDSGIKVDVPAFEGSEKFEFTIDSWMWDTLNEMRVVKDEDEIAVLQFTNDVSCCSHIAVMKDEWRKRQNGETVSMEFEAEAQFRLQSANRGCSRVGYNCICCSGFRNAILHYGHAARENDQSVPHGSLRLLDMGAEYHCYTADVTCTFPTDGSFSDDQKHVYESVWTAVKEVEQTLKPGVDYRDMQRLAQRVLLR
jgi:Xaa-Pro dipeptidase